MVNVKYDKDFFSLVRNLSPISPSVGFERVEKDGVEMIRARKKNDAGNIVYILHAPIECFDIQHTCSFFDFGSFFSIVNDMKNSELSLQENNDMYDYACISMSDAKFNYVLSRPEGIIDGPKKSSFVSGNIRFLLTKERIASIFKFSSMANADSVLVSKVDDEVTFNFYKSITSDSNTYSASFQSEAVDGMTNHDFKFIMSADVFKVLPKQNDFTVDIFSQKDNEFLRFSMVHDKYELDIYVPTQSKRGR